MLLLQAFRPILGPATCYHPISCGAYALQQLQALPAHKALWKITKQLSTCGPWYNYFKKKDNS